MWQHDIHARSELTLGIVFIEGFFPLYVLVTLHNFARSNFIHKAFQINVIY